MMCFYVDIKRGVRPRKVEGQMPRSGVAHEERD
jgi:hypothetical protein